MSVLETRVVTEWHDECAGCGNHQLPPIGEAGFFSGDEPLCAGCVGEILELEVALPESLSKPDRPPTGRSP